MKESEIQSAIDTCNTDLDKVNTEMDLLREKARAITSTRAGLETKLKLVALPPSPIRAQVLAAAGIESTESVMSDNV